MYKLITGLIILGMTCILPFSTTYADTQMFSGRGSTSSGFGTCVTVTTLPKSPHQGDIACVSDGASATDCVTGLASTKVTCWYSGAAWVSIGVAGASTVSDVAYNAGTWDGDTTNSPSKNAVRDKIESVVASIPSMSAPGAIGGGTPAAISGTTITATDHFSGSGSGLSAIPASALPNAAADGATKGVIALNANDFDCSSGVCTIDYTNGQAAATGAKGFLTSTDWNTFNGKLGTALTSAYIHVGNGSNVVAGVAMTGDVTISATGVTAVGSKKILQAMINDKAIAAAQLADVITRPDGSFIDLSGITPSNSTDEGIALPNWANVTPTSDKNFVTIDRSANALKFYNGGWVTVTPSGAPTTSKYLTLGYDATLSNEELFTPGVGLAATDAGANSTYTLAVDLSTLVGNQTLWNGSQSSRTLTFNLSGTDPVFTIGSSSVDLTTGTLKQGGTQVVLGSLGTTDNAIMRSDYSGSSTQAAQGSLATIDDSGSINIPSGQKYKINTTALAAADVGAGPSDAHYLTTQAEAGLSAESNLGALTTGLVKITVSGSVATPSTAAASDITGQLITGFSSGAGTVAGTDTILQAINKLDGNVGGKQATISFGTGALTALGNAVNGTGGFITYGNAAGTAAVLTGYSSGAGTVGTGDTILQAINKLNGNIAAKQGLDTDLTSLAGGITGLVKGGGDGNGYSAASAGTDYVIPSGNITGTSGGITGTPNITVGTISAGSAAFTVGSDGAVVVKSFTSAKVDSTPGRSLLYSSYGTSTDTYGAGWQGPSSGSSMGFSYYLALPAVESTVAGQYLATTGAPSSHITTMGWYGPALPLTAGSTVPLTGTLVGTTPAAGASGYASFRLPHGTAPTTNITDGDVWTTTSGMYVRINGGTVGPLLASAGSVLLSDIGNPTGAKTFTLLDNNASSLSFGATGKADILKIITTDAGEGVTMSGTLGVTGAVTVGSLNGHTFTTGSSTFTGTAGQTYTFPSTTATLARTDAANTFTGASSATSWALTTPVITTDIHAASIGGATVGTAVLPFSDIYMGGAAGPLYLKITGTAASTSKTLTVPNETGTFITTASTLGSWTSGAGTVGSGDTYLAALQKIDGNIAAKGTITTSPLLTTAYAYYVSAADTYTAADATNSAKMPAVCVAASATSCVYSGTVTTSGLTAGAIYYVSATTPGVLTATAPATTGQFIQRVGVALSTTVLLVMPSLDVGGL